MTRGKLRMSGYAALASSALLASSLPTHGAKPAYGYPQEPYNCNDDDLRWEFSNWTDANWWAGGVDRRPWVTSAINKLDDALDYDGTKLISVASGTNIIVKVRTDKPASEYGSAECVFPQASFWVNGNYTAASFYYKVARHEMFHLAGAEHGGQEDSLHWDGIKPSTMTSCITHTEFISSNLLEQDGHSYANYLHSSLANRQLTANIGFEQGFLGGFWKANGGAGPVYWYNTGGATGPGHIRYYSDSYNDFVYNSATVITGDDNESYRAVINARELLASYKTTVGVNLYRRQIDLPHNSTSNGCSYPDGIKDPNGNVTAVTGWVMAEQKIVDVGTDWTFIPTDWNNPVTAEAFHFQVRAGGYSDTGGADGPIFLDNARVEGT